MNGVCGRASWRSITGGHAIPPIRGVVETLDGAGNVTDSRAANLAVLRESWAADWALYAATGTGVLGVSGVTLAAIFYFV